MISPALAFEMALEQARFQMGEAAFECHLRGAAFDSYSGGVFCIRVQDEATREWLESRLATIFARQLAPLLGQSVRVVFTTPRENARPATLQIPATSLPAPDASLAAVLSNESDAECETLLFEEVSASIETSLVRPNRVVAFPRYELRFLPLLGAEAFFLRLAFLQACFLSTAPEGRGRPFETSVDNLIAWAGVGRATLHRFKKGDPSRSMPPAAPWFGIEQLPFKKASLQDPQLCRYRLRQETGLTPMDADRLLSLLKAAGIERDPLPVLRSFAEKPLAELLEFPAPAPTEEQRRRAPAFITVASVVWKALEGRRVEPEARAALIEAIAALADHITLPQQKILVSWYFLRQWLPLLGHDAAALVVSLRARGFYSAEGNELRDEVWIEGGYAELAQAIGLKRDRTIGDWLPNLYARREDCAPATPAGEKWSAELRRMAELQANLGRFVQVISGSRRKTPRGAYGFALRVALQSEPLTPADERLCRQVERLAQQCDHAGALRHLKAWAQSQALRQVVEGRPYPASPGNERNPAARLAAGFASAPIDGAGIAASLEMTARELPELPTDGWGILAGLLFDGAGIAAGDEVTVRESLKGLLRLNTFWESARFETTSTATCAGENPVAVVREAWDLRRLLECNGGLNDYRRALLAGAGEQGAPALIGFLCYAYSRRGSGLKDPLGWALARLKDSPPGAISAGEPFDRLATLPPRDFCNLLRRHIASGACPQHPDWRAAFAAVPLPRMKELAQVLGVAQDGAS